MTGQTAPCRQFIRLARAAERRANGGHTTGSQPRQWHTNKGTHRLLGRRSTRSPLNGAARKHSRRQHASAEVAAASRCRVPHDPRWRPRRRWCRLPEGARVQGSTSAVARPLEVFVSNTAPKKAFRYVSQEILYIAQKRSTRLLLRVVPTVAYQLANISPQETFQAPRGRL